MKKRLNKKKPIFCAECGKELSPRGNPKKGDLCYSCENEKWQISFDTTSEGAEQISDYFSEKENNNEED